MYAPGIYYNMFITSLTAQYCIRDLSTTPDDLNEKATITIVHAPLHSEEGVALGGDPKESSALPSKPWRFNFSVLLL